MMFNVLCSLVSISNWWCKIIREFRFESCFPSVIDSFSLASRALFVLGEHHDAAESEPYFAPINNKVSRETCQAATYHHIQRRIDVACQSCKTELES
jgi:hypothetical protein